MTAFITQPAPDFTAEAILHGEFGTLKLSDYRGKNVVLLFYPADFSFLCPTELLAFSDTREAFKARNAEIIGISVDSKFSHFAWTQVERREGGIKDIEFPLVSDLNKDIARAYGVLLPSGVALRGLFILNKEGLLKHATLNHNDLGRNVEEVLRLLDAIDFSEANGELCPANWKKGEKAMVASAAGLKEWAASK